MISMQNIRKELKKIESFIPERKMLVVDYICKANGYTRAEFMRRALDDFLNKSLKSKIGNTDLDDKIEELGIF